MSKDNFVVSALVDFADDYIGIAFTPGLVDDLIGRLQWAGVTRVYWNFYQRGVVDYLSTGTRGAETHANLGEPVAAGARAAHERGMEFFATIKPYETGASHANPANSPRVLAHPGLPGIGGVYIVDDWVAARPELRVKARAADLPAGIDEAPVRRIQLRQKDMAPVRIRRGNLEIWTSEDNVGYTRKDAPFDLEESVDTCPADVQSMQGEPISAKGDPVRVLDLTGLDLRDRFIAVTTNFDDDEGAFANTAFEMVRAYGPEGRRLPIVVASHKAVWRPQRDFRAGDLEYDAGVGDEVVRLDVDNSRPVSSGADGVIAFARGRNEYLSGSVCEAYPEVREYWLDWVGQCIAAGVDGVDVRISCHSSWTNNPETYGFNAPVAAEYERRYGANPDTGPYDAELLGKLRGEFFDEFLWAAKRRLSAAGKRLSVHAEMESFRPGACQGRTRSRPGNIEFGWRGWLSSGLADEATLFGRAWDPDVTLEDDLVLEMLDTAGAAGVPVHLSRQVGHGAMSEPDKLEYAYRSGKLAGYCFYETASMYDREKPLDRRRRLRFKPGLLEGIRERAIALGLREPDPEIV